MRKNDNYEEYSNDNYIEKITKKKNVFLTVFLSLLGIVLLGAGALASFVMLVRSNVGGVQRSVFVEVAEEMIPVIPVVEELLPEEPEEEPEPEEISFPTSSPNIRRLEDGTYRVDTEGKGLITFSFVGDILFDEGYAVGATCRDRGGNIANLFDEQTMYLMQQSDVFVVNNEFPYGSGGAPLPGKTYTFRAAPYTVNWLLDMGVDVAALANNHCYDFGQETFLSTLDILDEAKILHMGAGHNLEEAKAPLYFRLDDYTVAIINATQIERFGTPDTVGAGPETPGVFRCLDDGELLRDIREAKTKADFCIVMIHWGTEKETMPDELQYGRIGAMEQAGADLIVGGHSHCLQPITKTGNMYVIYSLGNYLFTSYVVDTGMLRVVFSPSAGRMESLQFVPMLQSNCRVTTLEGTDKERILGNLRSWSPNVTIDAEGYIQ